MGPKVKGPEGLPVTRDSVLGTRTTKKVLPVVLAGGSTSGVPGPRYVAGEVGHMPGVQECPSAPARPPSPRGRVEGLDSALPFGLRSAPLLLGMPSSGSCSVMAGPLCGRFHNHGSSR